MKRGPLNGRSLPTESLSRVFSCQLIRVVPYPDPYPDQDFMTVPPSLILSFAHVRQKLLPAARF
jgi:hypothetical protein